jgi:hypothetical protein
MMNQVASAVPAMSSNDCVMELLLT